MAKLGGKRWDKPYVNGGRVNPLWGFRQQYNKIIEPEPPAPVRELTEEERRELEARLLGRK